MSPPAHRFPPPPSRWAPWRFNWIANHRLARAIEAARGYASGQLLDVGCGSRPFARCLLDRVTHYWGTDLRSSFHFRGLLPEAYAAAGAQPIRSGSMDTVVAYSVMPYLTDPDAMCREVARVLRPGGHALIEFPQMEPVLYAPNDFFRYTRYGAQLLLERAGLEVVEVRPLGGLWVRIGLSAIGALNRINRGPTRVITELPVRAMYTVIQASCEILDRLFFEPDEPISNLIVARKPAPGAGVKV